MQVGGFITIFDNSEYIVAIRKNWRKSKLEIGKKTNDRDALVDISTVSVDLKLPAKERVKDYIRQIKDPYHYIDHGVEVTIKFAGKKPFEECLKDALFARDII